jgi:hypothetical protein
MFQKFATYVAVLVQRMAEVSGWISGAAAEQAVKFAEGAGKVIASIGGGVDGFAKLADMGELPGAALTLFAEALRQTMVQFGIISVGWTSEALAAAGAFADAAGKAVGILKTGIEGLLLLNTFTGTSADAIDRFGAGVRLAVAKMAQLAVEFGAEATAAAGAFADAAGQSTDFLKKGVEGFKKLGELEAIPIDGMALFATGVGCPDSNDCVPGGCRLD